MHDKIDELEDGVEKGKDLHNCNEQVVEDGVIVKKGTNETGMDPSADFITDHEEENNLDTMPVAAASFVQLAQGRSALGGIRGAVGIAMPLQVMVSVSEEDVRGFL